MDNLTGKMKPPSAAPARIVIEQDAKGQLTITHNLKPAYLIGVLSMFINITAGNMANEDAMLINPNKPRIISDNNPLDAPAASEPTPPEGKTN